MVDLVFVSLVLFAPRLLAFIKEGLSQPKDGDPLSQMQSILASDRLIDNQRTLLEFARNVLLRSVKSLSSIFGVHTSNTKDGIDGAKLFLTLLILSFLYPISIALTQWSMFGGAVKFGDFRIFVDTPEVSNSTQLKRGVLVACALGPPTTILLLKSVFSISISAIRLTSLFLVLSLPSVAMVGLHSHTVQLSIVMFSTLCLALAYSDRARLVLILAVVIISFPISHYIMSNPIGDLIVRSFAPDVVPKPFCYVQIEGYFPMSPLPEGGYSPAILAQFERCDKQWEFRNSLSHLGVVVTLSSVYAFCAFVVFLSRHKGIKNTSFLSALTLGTILYFLFINFFSWMRIGVSAWLFAPIFFFLVFPVANAGLDFLSLRFTFRAFSNAQAASSSFGVILWILLDAMFVIFCVACHSLILLVMATLFNLLFPYLVESPTNTISEVWGNIFSSNIWLLATKATVAVPSIVLWASLFYLLVFRLIVPHELYVGLKETVDGPNDDDKKSVAVWIQSLLLMSPFALVIMLAWVVTS